MRIASWLVVVYGGLLLVMVAWERGLVYPAPPRQLGDWSPAQVEVEDVYFESADGTALHGWLLEHPSPRAHILVCHGNGEHVAFFADDLARWSAQWEASIFVFDYRGYGKSQGKPHEQGVLQDGEAAHRLLALRAGINPDQVVLYGRSLGGAVAVHLAARLGARALIVERTFHSLIEVAAHVFWWAPVRWIMHNRYPASEWIANYHGPLLQLHGSDDEIVPLASAEKLFEACPSQRKQFQRIPGMGHNDPSPSSFRRAIKDLLKELPN